MADGVVLDLYAEDLDKDFSAQNQEEFSAEDVDLYDDIGAPPEAASGTITVTSVIGGESPGAAASGQDGTVTAAANGVYHQGSSSLAPNQGGRRFQLYVGNLTWVT